MKALRALYHNGKVFFPFDYPEYEAWVSVLVIFPDEDVEACLEAELGDGEWERE